MTATPRLTWTEETVRRLWLDDTCVAFATRWEHDPSGEWAVEVAGDPDGPDPVIFQTRDDAQEYAEGVALDIHDGDVSR